VETSVQNNSTNTLSQVAQLLQQPLASSDSRSMVEAAQDKVASGLKVDQRIFYQSKGKVQICQGDLHESTAHGPSKEKVPYCFRCKTKRHHMQDCYTPLYCDICDVATHSKAKCSFLKSAKFCAMPCGYAVEGLGFYHIPHTPQICICFCH
jgi:hypothetical protein